MGRTAAGVRGIRLADENDKVVGMICIDNMESSVLVVSENGYGKRSKVQDYRTTNRGGKGVKTISITGARQGILSLYVGINNEKNDDQLTEILIGLAHKEGNIDDQNTIKTGIDFLEREKKFLVVSGTSFFKVSPKDLQIEKLQKPVVDGKLIEGDRYKNWINTKQIRKADLKKTFEKVHKHLQQWQW